MSLCSRHDGLRSLLTSRPPHPASEPLYMLPLFIQVLVNVSLLCKTFSHAISLLWLFFSFNAIITWTDRLSDLTSFSLTTASSSLICLVHPSWHSSHLRLKDYSVFLEDSWVKLDLSLQLFVVLQTAKWEGLNSPWSNFHCLQCVYRLWNANFREYCIFKHLLLYFYYTFIYLFIL